VVINTSHEAAKSNMLLNEPRRNCVNVTKRRKLINNTMR